MVRLQDLLSDGDELQYDPVARFRQRQQEQRRQTPATRLPSLSTLIQPRESSELNATYPQQHTSTHQPASSTQALRPPGQQEYILYEYRQELHSDQSASQASAARKGNSLASALPQQPPCSCGCDPVSLEGEVNMLMSAAVATDHEQPPGSTTTASAVEGKQSRYLREMDRRAILKRLDRGEKQSTLAKEYHVSRSSICWLLKNRTEVLARVNHQNPFCKHPKKSKAARGTTTAVTDKATEVLVASVMTSYTPFTPAASLSRSRGDELLYGTSGGVYHVNSRATPVLLSTLDKPDLTAPDFLQCANQLMVQLVQEALVVVPALNATTKSSSSGYLPMPLCAITMEQNNQHALLDVFHSVEPRCSHGYIQFERSQWRSAVKIRMLDSSATLLNHSTTVLLLDVAVTSPPTVAFVLESLQASSGDMNVAIVAVFVTRVVVEMVRTRFPAVRIVATEIESGLPLAEPATPEQQTAAAAAGHGAMLMPRSLLFKQRLELWYPIQQQEKGCFTLAV